MAIIKIKNRKDYYVQIDKKSVEDKNLSFKATGLLVYLMGRPDDWKVMLSHLKTCKTDGIDSVRTALLELRTNDYCHLFEMRVKGVVRERFYYVFETPTPYCEDLLIRVMEDFYDAPDETSIVHVPVKTKTADRKDEIRDRYPQTDIPKMETPKLDIPKVESVNSEIDIYNSEILDEPVSEIDSFESQFFEDVETEPEISILELFEPETLELENLYDIKPEADTPKNEKPQVVKPETDYPQVDYPQVEKPETDKPKLENPTLLIKDYTNNRFTNKRTTKERVTNKKTTTKETNKENSSSSFSFFDIDNSLTFYNSTLNTTMKDTQFFSKKNLEAVLYNPAQNKSLLFINPFDFQSLKF